MLLAVVRACRWILPLGLVVTAVTVGSANADERLKDVRVATAKYHSVAAAEAAGYGDPGLPCFDRPDTGQGMGFHLVNGQLLGDHGALDRTHPEALVYEVRDGSLKLVAVEYLMLMSDWSSQDPPEFLGQPMIANPTLGLWTLHAWIWRDNPDGLFQTWNANVGPCPQS